MIVAGLMSLVGYLFCLSTPEETGAQTYIYIAVGAIAINTMISIISMLSIAGVVAELPQAVTLSSSVIQLVGTVCFLLFLKKVAEFIARSDLAASAQNVLNISLVVMVLTVGMVLVAIAGPVMLSIAGILGLIVAILGIVLFVMYILLLGKMRTALNPR